MFESPTIDDFEMQLADVAGEAAQQFGREIRGILDRLAARGVRHSSMSVLQTLDAMDSGFDVAVSGILRQVARVIEKTDLAPATLRSIGHKRVMELAEIIPRVAISQLGDVSSMQSMQTVIQERIELLKERGVRRLRQFDVGFWEDPAAIVAGTSNSISAGTIIGGIQQGTRGSTQSVSVEIDASRASQAVEAFEQVLSEAELDQPTRNELASEIDTIKAQLRKGKPSTTILREAGQSIRSIVEGVTSGMLTPGVLAAAAALAATLGS